MRMDDGTVISHAEVSPHKFGGDPMAEYLYRLAGDGSADESTGDAVDWHYLAHRFGKRVMVNTSMGFVEVVKYDDVDEAIAAMRDHDLEYRAYDNDFHDDPSLVPDLMGGYWLIAVMEDGGTLCEKCLCDPENPVKDRRDMADENPWDAQWAVVGFDYSGNYDEFLACDHCNKVLVEGDVD